MTDEKGVNVSAELTIAEKQKLDGWLEANGRMAISAAIRSGLQKIGAI